jgi:hypothetical protein
MAQIVDLLARQRAGQNCSQTLKKLIEKVKLKSIEGRPVAGWNLKGPLTLLWQFRGTF